MIFSGCDKQEVKVSLIVKPFEGRRGHRSINMHHRKNLLTISTEDEGHSPGVGHKLQN